MKTTFLFLTFLISIVSLTAHDSIVAKNNARSEKNFLLENRPWTIGIPLWIPGYAGLISYGDIELEGEDGIDPGDPDPDPPPPGGDIGKIFKRLFSGNWTFKFIYMGHIGYENKGFLVHLDGFGGSVSNSVKFNYNNKEIVSLKFQTVNTRLYLGYKVLSVDGSNQRFRYKLYPYLGVRSHINDIFSDLDRIDKRLDVDILYFEPLIGVQNVFTWKRWLLLVRGDYGGIFTGSSSTVVVQLSSTYLIGRFFSIRFGWSHMETKKKGTLRNEDYDIKLTLSGPNLGIGFHF